MIVGVDTGGTFTDLVVVDGPRRTHHKLRSTPDDASRAVLDGLAELGVDLARVERFVHGTTVATNTIIERRGARTGFLTTGGHRDIPQIRRGNKPESEVFDLGWHEPEPLVPRYRRLDVAERLDAHGRELVPLSLDELEAAAEHFEEHGVESVAICFLFSYLDGAHERQAADFLRERAPGLELSLSSEILPQWREYERAATTIADAYVKPTLARYLASLADSLDRRGLAREPLIMKSNGGVMTAGAARARPVDTFLSGPAGGVVAAAALGRRLGAPNLIATDMGGTSFDVAVVTGGEAGTTTHAWLDPSTPISLAMLDIRSIGAGGGSIAWIDAGGGLKVGPRSAGAVPGPACYARGGDEPTVTDANLVLGRLGARSLLGGRLELDPELARRALERRVCEPLGLDLLRAAAGVVRICASNMATEIRTLTAERGVNPRDYALLAGGGAGPLHAALLAREFGIARVVVPAHPGLLSAEGLVLSDLRVDRVKSFPLRLEQEGTDALSVAAGELLDDVAAELRAEGFAGTPTLSLALDMKYVGQNWDITVPVEPGAFGIDRLAAAFDAEHERLYGFALPQHRHAVLALRASAVGATGGAPPVEDRDVEPRGPATRPVYDDDAEVLVETPVLAWAGLAAGERLDGPVVVEGLDATVWIPRGGEGAVGPDGEIDIVFPSL